MSVSLKRDEEGVRRNCFRETPQQHYAIKGWQKDYNTMTLEREDIIKIAKDNWMTEEEIQLDEWIEFEEKILHRVADYQYRVHNDIKAILEHLKAAYEDHYKGALNIKTSIEECKTQAHYDAISLRKDEERGKADMDEVFKAYAIFYFIRDTQKYLQDQLSWRYYNKYYR